MKEPGFYTSDLRQGVGVAALLIVGCVLALLAVLGFIAWGLIHVFR